MVGTPRGFSSFTKQRVCKWLEWVYQTNVNFIFFCFEHPDLRKALALRARSTEGANTYSACTQIYPLEKTSTQAHPPIQPAWALRAGLRAPYGPSEGSNGIVEVLTLLKPRNTSYKAEASPKAHQVRAKAVPN